LKRVVVMVKVDNTVIKICYEAWTIKFIKLNTNLIANVKK